MRFGDLPSWAVELSALIREAICVGDASVGLDAEVTNEDEDACPLPSDLLWREPFFDQMIANRYKPGEVRNCLMFTGNVSSTTSRSRLSHTPESIDLKSSVDLGCPELAAPPRLLVVPRSSLGFGRAVSNMGSLG